MTPPPPPTKQFALKANGHPTLIYISFDVYREKQLLRRSNKSQSITYAVGKPFDLSPIHHGNDIHVQAYYNINYFFLTTAVF